MNSDSIAINDVLETLIDYRGKTPHKTSQGIRLITAKVIKNGTITDTSFEYISEADYDEVMRRGLPAIGDILITTEAPLGEVAQIKSNQKIALAQRVILLRTNPNKMDSKYLLYALQSPLVQAGLYARASGTTVLGIKQPELRKVLVPNSPIEVQNKVASILSSYDDLIENNNRRIAILEEMARSLYREWFVKFRFPGHEEVKMIDSELGQIPEGWSILKVDKLVDFHIGGGWGQEKPDEKHSQPAYVIRGTDINHVAHGNSSVIPYRFHSVSNLKSRKLEIGDIVFEVSGGSKGQPVGRALLVSKKLLNNLHEDVMCASFCKLIRGNNIVPAEYFYLHLKEIYDNGQIDKYQVQSTGITNFKFQVFLEQEKVLIPPEAILEKFLQPIQSFFDQINIFGFKNLNLKTQRDMLLPKLISGKIPVI